MAGLTYANQVGAALGLNQAAPGTFITDDHVRWSQDILFDRVGLLRRRPPFQTINLYDTDGITLLQPNTAGERLLGLVTTQNLDDEPAFAIIVSDNVNTKFYFYDKDFTLKDVTTAPFSSNIDTVFVSNSSLNTGAWLSFIDEYGIINSGINDHYLYYWRGGTGTHDYSIANSFTLGSSGAGDSKTYTNSITASFDTDSLSKGMFAFIETGSGDSYYLGVVKSFDPNFVYLEKNIIRFFSTVVTSGSGYTLVFKNIRPYIHCHGRGLITWDGIGDSVLSGPIGSEGEGHFAAAKIDNTYDLYRASDNKWIGRVNTVPDNETLTLNTTFRDITVTMKGDEYILRKYNNPVVFAQIYALSGGTTAAQTIKTTWPGVFTATYSGYQWYANNGLSDTQSRVVFSATHNAEAVDLSLDAADSIILPSTQQMRGMAASSNGLLVFFEDKTYIIRGNYRLNFSVEELFPEGCLSAQSIVEFGGGVFWASKRGILLYDGNSVRNLVEENLGSYYTDSVKTFDAVNNTIYSFVYKDYLFVHFTRFDSSYNPIRYEPIYAEGIDTTEAIQNYSAEDWDPDFEIDDFDPANNVPIYWDYIKMYGNSPNIEAVWGDNSASDNLWGEAGVVWGPVATSPGMTFAIFLPTNAITTISNFEFRDFVTLDIVDGVRGFAAIDAVNSPYNINEDLVYGASPRIIDIDSMLEIKNDHEVSVDSELCYNIAKPAETYIKGPDMYLQTKHYTFGDPTLRKWFRQLFINLYQIDGGLRLDIVDNEDKDVIDIEKKKHKNWEIFTEDLYNWGIVQDVILPKVLSPKRSTWQNVEDIALSWYEFSDAQYERRKKQFSWRYPSMGFRLYQMNNFRPRNYQTPQRPHTVAFDSWSIGFKPMRQTRV